MKIVHATLTPFALPLARPIVTATQRIARRSGLLLRLFDDQGHCGMGEATPLAGFGLETVDEAHAALREFIPALFSRRVDTLRALLHDFRIAHPKALSACSALDTALCDLAAQQERLSIAQWLARSNGTKPRPSIPVNALLVERSPAALAKEVSLRIGEGYRTVKLKVGKDTIVQDCARLSLVRRNAGPRTRIRLDANGAWSPSQALEAIRAYSAYEIELLEQPVSATDLDGLAKVRAHSPIPIAADESALGPEAARLVIERQAADVIVLKPSAVGGLHAALDIARRASDASIDLFVTSLLDGAVGRCMALHFAATLFHATQPSDLACGLATGELLDKDIARAPKPVRGEIAVPQQPGLGIQLAQALWSELVTGPTKEFKI